MMRGHEDARRREMSFSSPHIASPPRFFNESLVKGMER